MPSSSYGGSSSVHPFESELEKLWLSLVAGECTDALPPDEVRSLSGYTTTRSPEPELTVKVVLLFECQLPP